jgi:hypothetical protein
MKRPQFGGPINYILRPPAVRLVIVAISCHMTFWSLGLFLKHVNQIQKLVITLRYGRTMLSHLPVETDRKMKKRPSKILGLTVAAVCLASALLLVAGCGQKGAKLTSDQSKAFDGAPPEVKQAWEKALAADKANDYVVAQTSLDSLNHMILSDAQRQALDTESAAFGLRLMQAVEKNDPAALKAVQEINKTRSRRK